GIVDEGSERLALTVKGSDSQVFQVCRKIERLLVHVDVSVTSRIPQRELEKPVTERLTQQQFNSCGRDGVVADAQDELVQAGRCDKTSSYLAHEHGTWSREGGYPADDLQPSQGVVWTKFAEEDEHGVIDREDDGTAHHRDDEPPSYPHRRPGFADEHRGDREESHRCDDRDRGP